MLVCFASASMVCVPVSNIPDLVVNLVVKSVLFLFCSFMYSFNSIFIVIFHPSEIYQIHMHIYFIKCCYFQGIPMAPLWDFNRGHFVGVLSALDFILIMREASI